MSTAAHDDGEPGRRSTGGIDAADADADAEDDGAGSEVDDGE